MNSTDFKLTGESIDIKTVLSSLQDANDIELLPNSQEREQKRTALNEAIENLAKQNLYITKGEVKIKDGTQKVFIIKKRGTFASIYNVLFGWLFGKKGVTTKDTATDLASWIKTFKTKNAARDIFLEGIISKDVKNFSLKKDVTITTTQTAKPAKVEEQNPKSKEFLASLGNLISQGPKKYTSNKTSSTASNNKDNTTSEKDNTIGKKDDIIMERAAMPKGRKAATKPKFKPFNGH